MAKKKVTRKKAATKKAPARKKAATKKAAATGPKAPTKSELFATIADDTGLTKRQVADVFESLNGVIAKNLKPRGAQTFSIPGICKMVVKKKPATKARKGINPFTGEEIMFKAKPASKQVKIRPL